MTTETPWAELYQTGLSAIAPHCSIFGPTRGWRPLAWSADWAYGDFMARNPNPVPKKES